MTSTDDMDWAKNRRRQLEGALAQDPTSYEELRITIESVLKYTEWPLESNEAAGNLLRMVQQKPRLTIDYSDPEKATQAMQIVWQQVKEASLTYDTHKRRPIFQVKTLLGGGAKGCTEVLTACRAVLPSSSPQLLGPKKADDRQNIHHKSPPAPRFFRPPPRYVRPILPPRFVPPSPPRPPRPRPRPAPLPKISGSISRHKLSPPTLRDDEIRQPISPMPVKVNGHFCDVFEGTHSTAGKVALKRPRIGTAGYNEDVVRGDGYFYFVSPFIENGTLVEYIALHPSVNRIKLLCETAYAISYLHKEDVVHGNIKASSLLTGDSGQVLLCASVSGLTMSADVRTLRTFTEVNGAGTLRWQSPEVLEGGSKSFKSDVYAFGMTIAEILTGDVPFPDLRTGAAVITAVWIQCKRPPRSPAVSSAGLSYENVWAVAEACWPTVPEKRISMSEALQMIQADPAVPAIEESTSSSFIGDIGSFIISVSNDPVKVNGHFCDVFEGVHLTAGRVALKRPRIGGIDDEAATIRRFEREAMTWRSLRHPHILEFLGTFRRDRHLYLVNPFINNGTLVEYISRHPETNRVQLLCETADALKYLHKNRVVHGDIKGGNILIDDNIHCLLCDFGLTKVTQSRTSTAMRGAGTFRWQSPELWFDAPKSFSSDAYAFSMTIVEVLTGEAPFAHLNNDTAVMFAVVNKGERPPKVPTKSPSGMSYLGAWDVAEACWSQNPEERISMSAAFQRLQEEL